MEIVTSERENEKRRTQQMKSKGTAWKSVTRKTLT